MSTTEIIPIRQQIIEFLKGSFLARFTLVSTLFYILLLITFSIVKDKGERLQLFKILLIIFACALFLVAFS